ncbi:MAG: zinc-dependent metalloprotease [Planctomycetota bacterium]
MVTRMTTAVATALVGGVLAGPVAAQDKKPEFPPWDKVSDGYKKVDPSGDATSSLYTLYVNKKTNDVLAELPRGWDNQKYFVAVTQASGGDFAGLQGPERLVYWRRYDKLLAMLAPELQTRSTGEPESRSSVKRLFTDRVLLDVPIVAMGPSGQPVIDLDNLLVGKARELVGFGGGGGNPRLARIAKAKGFNRNIEVAFEAPGFGGKLATTHYSISLVPKGGSYKPRVADERVGYFMTTYRDLGEYGPNEGKWKRYIHRWNLEKRDPKLKLSPPKEPIVFYVEHTAPVRYRRWIRAGVEYWNEAFREIGFDNAIEVYYQDKSTGAHMEKDPEDVRYNFIRWLNNDISTAIGPSRAHPMTGQILDADIVLTDGWIRAFWRWYNEDMPQVAMDGMTPETMLWFEENPDWDPRLLIRDPVDRERIMLERSHRRDLVAKGEAKLMTDVAMGENPYMQQLSEWMGKDAQLCMAADHLAFDMAFASLMMTDFIERGEDADGNADDADLLDGIPEWFIGPMLADLVCHEVGHTLGLRHNFKASSIYTMDEINSEEWKGKKAMTGSVMDYNPNNFNFKGMWGDTQGDYAMMMVGPYDKWAIEYGYTTGKLDKVLERTAEPELAYLTDDDTTGPDPYARRYDLSKNPIEFATNQMAVVEFQRDRILSDIVKDGQSWSNARRAYSVTLSQQMRMLSMMSNWIGGAHVSRARKGDNDSAPLEVVDPERQREALDFVINKAFYDEAFGLTPELLLHMTVDKWSDWSAGDRSDPTWPVHDRVMGIQASAVSMVMNPTTLSRVYDNEFRTPSDQDALTVAEVMNSFAEAIYTELDADLNGETFTNREPMISSLRRNLQSQMTDRLIALATRDDRRMPRPLRTLAMDHLRRLDGRLEGVLEKADDGQVDEYTAAHLRDLEVRISKALDAMYIIQ